MKAERTVPGADVEASAITVLIARVQARGVDIGPLLSVAPYAERAIEHPSSRLAWSEFSAFLDGVEEAIGGPVEMERLGVEVIAADPVSTSCRADLDLRCLYLTACDRAFRHPCHRGAYRLDSMPDGRLRIEAAIVDPYRPSMPYWRLRVGNLRAYPCLLGMREAGIEADLSPRRAAFLADLPVAEGSCCHGPAPSGRGRQQDRAAMLSEHVGILPAHHHFDRRKDRTARVSHAAREWEITARQAEVMEMLLRGMGNKEIASAIGCTEKTVELHVTQVLRKSGLPSRAALIARMWGGRQEEK